MHRKLAILVTMMLITMLTLCSAASGSNVNLTLNADTAVSGDVITASGASGIINGFITIKILDSDGNIIYNDPFKTDNAGNFSTTFVVPNNTEGVLTVVVGSGTNVDVEPLIVGTATSQVSLELSKEIALAGDEIVASGSADVNSWVVIKVLDRAGNIQIFESAKADSNGHYEKSVIIPNLPEGLLTVVAGTGDNVAVRSLLLGTVTNQVSLELSRETALVGDEIVVSGSADVNSWVVIKVLDSTGNIQIFDSAKAGSNGHYEKSVTIPNLPEGLLTVVAGTGDNVAVRSLLLGTATSQVTLELSSGEAVPGDSVTASGAANANTWVVVKVVDSTGNIVCFDAAKAKTDGTYSISFSIPEVEEGILQVISGYGDNAVNKNLTITSAPVDECFIATAAYGSKFQPSVALLRAFRDKYLLTNKWGKSFVAFYYRNSPPVAAMIANNETLKAMVRGMLTPVVGVVYLVFHPMLMFLILGLFMWLAVTRLRRKKPSKIA
jgi:hypothetical protein